MKKQISFRADDMLPEPRWMYLWTHPVRYLCVSLARLMPGQRKLSVSVILQLEAVLPQDWYFLRSSGSRFGAGVWPRIEAWGKILSASWSIEDELLSECWYIESADRTKPGHVDQQCEMPLNR